MEFQLLNFLCISRTLCKEDFFVVASHKMSTHHGLWLANDFELCFFEGCLHDTVIELNNEHELVETSECLCEQLHALNFVAVEPAAVHFPIFWAIYDFVSTEVFSWHELEASTKHEEGLLIDISIRIISILIKLKPGV